MYLGQLPEKYLLDNIHLPDEVIINGIPQENINYTYYFNETENIVKIKYYSQEDVNNVAINKCFFYQCTEITEIDLSEFDTSQFTTMYAMFSECHFLSSLNLKNFNTSNVERMDIMFYLCKSLTSINTPIFDTNKVVNMSKMFEGCKSLLSLDLSNFISSEVQNIDKMFYGCISLTSLNLSNFNTSNLNKISNTFYDCHNLEYLNLQNFKNELIVGKNDFYNISINIVVCTYSEPIIDIINSTNCSLITCDENWKEKQNKINTENNECTNDCLNINYKYLYGSKCVKNCPTGTFNNSYICENCHEDCNICTNKYSYNSSNCLTCLDENKFINLGNCVSNCKNGHYDYINETLNLTIKTCKCDLENCFQCSQESLFNNNSCITCNKEKGYFPLYNEIYNINNFIKCYNSPEGFYLDIGDLLYKKCYNSCKNCNKSGNEFYHNCIECKEDYIYEVQFDDYKNCYDNYINCSFSCYYDIAKHKFYCTQNLKCESTNCSKISKYKFRNYCYSDCPNGTIKSFSKSFYCEIICNETQPFELINKQICTDYCNLNLIKTKLCILKYQKIQKVENLEKNNEEYNENEKIKVQNMLLDNYEKGFTSEDYNTSKIDQGQDDIYEEKEMRVIFSNLDNQKKKEKEKNNFTSIKFGECEQKLRDFYKIPENKQLYMKIIEIPIQGMKIPKIEYEIYCKLNNTNLVHLDKSICGDIKIEIIIPIILDDEINKLNASSDYYNDICYTTTSDSGTDITLTDRRNEFIKYNKTVCQENCLFSEYNYEIQKAYCFCEIKQSSKSFADMHIDTAQLYKNFVDFKNIMNIKILTCFNILFNKKSFQKNIGFFISMINILFHLISAIILYKIDWNLLNIKIDDIFVAKHYLQIYGKEKKMNLKKSKNKNRNIIIKKEKNFSNIKENKIINKKVNLKNKVTKKTKSIINNNYISIYNFHGDSYNNFKKCENNIEKPNSFSNLKITNSTTVQTILEKSKKILEFDEEELNNLSYKLALKNDKRTYTEYFISLLKAKHILFFSFCNSKDYNSRIIKIDLFFIGFILDYTINALFFNDETMHKIYEDKGTFNFVYQLPQIIYSYLISSVFSTLLQLLALSEDDIINYKQNNINKKEIDLKRKLYRKFISFFILGFIFLLCFEYYLSMFCAIYVNTQIHLIKDTLISFGFSFVSPIFIYIFPGIFRIPALSNPKKQRKYLFIISKIFQMI